MSRATPFDDMFDGSSEGIPTNINAPGRFASEANSGFGGAPNSSNQIFDMF